MATSGNSDAFVITRTFNAPRALVWKAFTDVNALTQWFGPKGFTMFHAKLDFRPGGTFHYGMRSPDGHAMWGKFVYREIAPQTRLVHTVQFSDEQGGITRHPMSATWPQETLSDTTLEERDGKTILTMRLTAHNATAEEQKTFDQSHNSMKQGWSGAMNQLDDYLAKIQA